MHKFLPSFSQALGENTV